MRETAHVQVRWADLDGYGHVNNAALFTLLEDARVQTLWASDELEAGPMAIVDGSPRAESWTVIARQEAEYLGQIPHHRRPLQIDVWIGRLGGASVQVCYEVFSPDRSEQYAKAATTVVMVDAASGSPRRLTEAERAAWEPYVEDPIDFRHR
ncbi:thioesterase family protein [uncultured Agrococcus sp.]|uniref:acyl-CoA thioesterase n=1 Tax=uncultured Agrococcus sp. TaxID=382258 RepID=UPI0025DE8448|nr:thioesterase family protein [uncultured Agrococcus sp.]